MLRRIVKYILCLGFSIFVTYILSIFLIPYAYSVRGYHAIGGEHFLLLFVLISTFYFTASFNEKE